MLSRFEQEILIAHALGLTRAQLLAKRPDEIAELTTYNLQLTTLFDRRAKHEPTAYIVGYQPFYGLDFFVDRSVLIPRPETELLVEIALKQLTTYNLQLTTILDIGTGSGCIAVSLAKNLPNAKIIGVDVSPAALEIAEKNAKNNNVSDRCTFTAGDMFEKISGDKFDLIISNPPYIPTQVIETLEPEVKDWEPRQALDGGPDGLNYVRELIEAGPAYLKEDGLLAFEFGFSQAAEITKLAKDKFKTVEIIRDYAGLERIFIGQP